LFVCRKLIVFQRKDLKLKILIHGLHNTIFLYKVKHFECRLTRILFINVVTMLLFHFFILNAGSSKAFFDYTIVFFSLIYILCTFFPIFSIIIFVGIKLNVFCSNQSSMKLQNLIVSEISMLEHKISMFSIVRIFLYEKYKYKVKFKKNIKTFYQKKYLNIKKKFYSLDTYI